MNSQPSLFDQEAEQAVLGSILYRNDQMEEVAAMVQGSSFYQQRHQSIFKAMLELHEKNEPIDEVLIGDKLKGWGLLESSGGYAYLAELVDCVPSSGNVAYYTGIIAKKAYIREVAVTFGRSYNALKCEDLDLSSFQKNLEEMAQQTHFGGQILHSQKLKELSPGFIDRLERITKAGNPSGMMTGYPELDDLTLGLNKGKLVVIAARPSIGKTAFSGCLSLNFAKDEAAGLNFSLEMENEEMHDRYICQAGKVDSTKLKSGNLETEDWDKLTHATDLIADLPIRINDRANSLAEIINQTILHHKTEPLSYIVVDYLQLMVGRQKPNSTNAQEFSEIARELKNLAKRLGIVVIALSQLNRGLESRSDKRPRLSDLKESGGIEEAADLVFFIYRDEVYNEDTPDKGVAEINLAGLPSRRRSGFPPPARLRNYASRKSSDCRRRCYSVPWYGRRRRNAPPARPRAWRQAPAPRH